MSCLPTHGRSLKILRIEKQKIAWAAASINTSPFLIFHTSRKGCRGQTDRGLVPSRWRRRWLTALSLGMAIDIGKAILAAMPVHERPRGAFLQLLECGVRQRFHGLALLVYYQHAMEKERKGCQHGAKNDARNNLKSRNNR